MTIDKRFFLRTIVLVTPVAAIIAAALSLVAPEASPPIAEGVLVESGLGAGDLTEIGLVPGDVLLAWEEVSKAPVSSLTSKRSRSIFELYWFLLNHSRHAPVTLMIERGQREITLENISLEELDLRSFWLHGFVPMLPPGIEERILLSRSQVDSGDLRGAEALLATVWPDQSSERWRIPCWLSLRRASILLVLGEAEKAASLLLGAYEIAQSPEARVAVLRLSAEAHQAANDLAPAEGALRTALDLQESNWAAGLHLSGTLGRIGLLRWRQGDYDSAEHFIERAVNTAETYAPGSIGHAAWLGNLGLLLESRGDLAGAAAHQELALGLQRKRTPSHPNIARGWINLGTISLRRGRLSEAAEYFRTALEMSRSLEPESDLVAAALGNLGTVELERGDLELAEEYSHQSQEMWQRLFPGGKDEADSLNRLGGVYRERGQLGRAEEYLLRSLAIYKALSPKSVDVAAALEGLGSISRERGKLDEARTLFERALEMRRQIAPNHFSIAVGLNRLGFLSYEQGALDESKQYYLEALEYFDQLEIETIDTAEALFGLGLLTFSEGDQENALVYSRRSIEVLETQMEHLGGPSYLKASYRQDHGYAYRALIEILLDSGRHEEAFDALERSRGVEFLEVLHQRDLEVDPRVDDSLLTERRKLATTYDQLFGQLTTLDVGKQPEQLASVRSQMWQIWRELESVTEEIRQQSPQLAALQLPEPLDVKYTQEILDPGTVLLSYSVGDKTTEVFVLTDDHFEVQSVDLGVVELRQWVTHFREVLDRAVPGDTTGALELFDSLGRRLYQLLVEPVEKVAESEDRLLVVPNGPLHYLPWAALVRSSGEYLIEWKPIHVALSATVYSHLKQRRLDNGSDSGRMELFALGAPQYSDMSDGDKEPVDEGSTLGVPLGRGFRWQPLPHSQREVTTIAALYPPDKVRVLVGEEASEDAVMSLCSGTKERKECNPRILHVATHTHMDNRFPLNSGLVMSPSLSGTLGHSNGLLQVWEILEKLRLDTDLVPKLAHSSFS